MRKIVIIIFITLTTVNSIAQFQNFESCKHAKKLARKDSKNGNFKLVSGGLQVELESDTNKLKFRFESKIYYKKVMLEKYKIEFIDGGCIRREFDHCYYLETKRLIESKYGIGFIDSTITKLKREYRLLPDIEKSKFVDTTEFYLHYCTNPKAKFVYGNDSLTKAIKFILNSTTELNWKGDRVDIFYLIDKNGEIENLEIISSLSESEKELAKMKILELNLMEAGKLYGKSVKSDIYLTISN